MIYSLFQWTLATVFLLQVFAGAGTKSPGDNKATDPGSRLTPGELIFSGSFDENFERTGWKETFGAPWYHCAGGCQVIEGGFSANNSLRVAFPHGSVGPGEGGAQFPIVFDNIPGQEHTLHNELFLSYYFKFEDGFDFRLGGKLPGLMGGGNSWVRSGGNQPDGTNGWTLRFMWRSEGRIVVYAYVPPSGNGKWGSRRWGQDIDLGFSAVPGKWHRLEQYVNVGSPGKDDGRLIVWIDGEKKLSIEDMRFRDNENDFGLIGGIYFSTFHGGNTPDWGPLHDSYMQFADFRAYRPATK
jgi:hypothetical protein